LPSTTSTCFFSPTESFTAECPSGRSLAQATKGDGCAFRDTKRASESRPASQRSLRASQKSIRRKHDRGHACCFRAWTTCPLCGRDAFRQGRGVQASLPSRQMLPSLTKGRWIGSGGVRAVEGDEHGRVTGSTAHIMRTRPSKSRDPGDVSLPEAPVGGDSEPCRTRVEQPAGRPEPWNSLGVPTIRRRLSRCIGDGRPTLPASASFSTVPDRHRCTFLYGIALVFFLLFSQLFNSGSNQDGLIPAEFRHLASTLLIIHYWGHQRGGPPLPSRQESRRSPRSERGSSECRAAALPRSQATSPVPPLLRWQHRMWFTVHYDAYLPWRCSSPLRKNTRVPSRRPQRSIRRGDRAA
jgi:hypothetical protein